jgi:endonuclease G
MTFKDSAPIDALFSRYPKLADEIRQLASEGKLPGLGQSRITKEVMEQFLDPSATTSAPRATGLEIAHIAPSPVDRQEAALEAIVISIGRPSLLVQNGTYVVPPGTTEEVKRIIDGFNRDTIDHVIARSARVELIDIPRIPYVGTGWIIEKPAENRAIIVTNRHVAEYFAVADGAGGYRFRTAPNFRPYETRVDFKEEHRSRDALEAQIIKVLFIAGPRDPDIALLEAEGDVLVDMTPIGLSDKHPVKDMDVGVVGYPAYDSRNDPNDVARYFGDIFDVKRFAFGEINSVSTGYPEFSHDATTLGGNSGSCVFDLESGKAAGLHFAGDYRVGNYAVPGAEILRALSGLKSTVVVPRPGAVPLEARGDGKSPVNSFKGRNGYRSRFLGRGNTVSMPKLGAWEHDVAKVVDSDTGRKTKYLKYRHFSVIMSQSRKLPLITAVNIDGSRSKRLGRVDKWYIDERLSHTLQVDNDAYYKNPLDRGHMVRREDPVWGTLEQAAEANRDTFHYTNCAPQHEGLNQRDWVALEDYILGSARTHRLRISVFTGPVFKDDDPLYRDIVRLPRSFWKIAVLVDTDKEELSATGYILCQGELIKNITEAFVYGDFRTYQVPLSLIERETRLDLKKLIPFDPFESYRRREGLEETLDSLFFPISSSEDIMFD